MERAIDEDGLTYPVAQDNDYATWTAYGNQYWPAKYLIDARGRVRFVHFGEGSYAETERAIRSLLAEAGQARLGGRAKARAETADPEVATPESYLGASRADRFANGPIRPGSQVFGAIAPSELPPDHLAYAGGWRISGESATAGQRCEPRAELPGATRLLGHGLPRRARAPCGCCSTATRFQTRSPARTSAAVEPWSPRNASTGSSTCRGPGATCCRSGSRPASPATPSRSARRASAPRAPGCRTARPGVAARAAPRRGAGGRGSCGRRAGASGRGPARGRRFPRACEPSTRRGWPAAPRRESCTSSNPASRSIPLSVPGAKACTSTSGSSWCPSSRPAGSARRAGALSSSRQNGATTLGAALRHRGEQVPVTRGLAAERQRAARSQHPAELGERGGEIGQVM